MIFKNVLPLALGALFIVSCEQQESFNPAQDAPGSPSAANGLKKKELKARSKTPSFLALTPQFKDVAVYPLLSSEDQLPESPEFVYGSMADGMGLMKNDDGGFTLINNIEADYSVARIFFDQNFRPIKGEHILNATATANTAQCSGTLITPEEHGFGPLYLSGGEWGGSSKGVFLTNPFRDAGSADVPEMLTAMGQWSTENAVPIGKDAYPGKTVVFIGDDHSDNSVPSGQLGMYVGEAGDLHGGKLYGLKVTAPGVNYEMDMQEGTAYEMEFVELNETNIDLLDAEAKAKGVMGFSRLEDIDWRRGNAKNNREVYIAVTGRKNSSLAGKGTTYGRVYKLELNDADPTKAGKITCVLDGDLPNGKAKSFHSPDNILVTKHYAYIQEDPNGYFDSADKQHFARLYQYNLNNGELKVVLECDQATAASMGYGNLNSDWELTGMIDVSDVLGVEGTFLLITQNHGWVKADGTPFTDPKANPNVAGSEKEGSQLYLIQGLKR
jgi:hypothetical protein